MIGEETINALLKSIVDTGLDGKGPLTSAKLVAEQYKADAAYKNAEECVDAIIKWEAAKSFGSGFALGFGGGLTIPASLAGNWVLGSRMSGAIAEMNGYSSADEKVRSFVMLSLLGKKLAGETLRTAGVHVGNRLAFKAVQAVPGAVLREINKAVGFRLITKAGQKGVVNLARFIPVAGAIVGGAVDAGSTMFIGRTAKKLFGAGLDLDAPEEQQ
jgi:hypothetical protein